MEIGVSRLDGKFFAWIHDCPHQGGPVYQDRFFRPVEEIMDEAKASHGRTYADDGLLIACPWHGFEYDVRTGLHPGAAPTSP